MCNTSSLKQLPNIGNTLAELLVTANIKSSKDLLELGSEKAFIRINTINPEACINMLYALEGATQGIRWHHLDKGRKAELTEFYKQLTKIT